MKFAAWSCIVAAALAAMAISYSGLNGLARMVGYSTMVAPLLPIAIDVAIIGATLVWLGQGAPRQALNFSRLLALVAISTSVLANATFHGLTGGENWRLGAVVAAIPPAFLAALVHLGALLVRKSTKSPESGVAWREVTISAPAPASSAGEPGDGLATDASEAGEPGGELVSPASAAGESLVTVTSSARDDLAFAQDAGEILAPVASSSPAEDGIDYLVRQILDEAARTGTKPPGRPAIARQLGTSEHQVRKALDTIRQADTNGGQA